MIDVLIEVAGIPVLRMARDASDWGLPAGRKVAGMDRGALFVPSDQGTLGVVSGR